MKKKGLIISTVVMVVVLIAALTTTTFAWFTVSSETKVEAMSVTVNSDAAVRIGLLKENDYATSSTSVGDDSNKFVTGNVQWGGTSSQKWTGDAGLSPSLVTGLSFNLTKGVYTGSAATTMDNKGSWDPKHTLYAANGQDGNDNAINTGTMAAAVQNGSDENGTSADYLHLTIGIQAIKDNINEIDCVMTLNLSSNTGRTNLGMNAAINYVYEIDKPAMGATATGVEKRNKTPQEFFTTKSGNDEHKTATENDGIITIQIHKEAEASGKIDSSKIYVLDLYIFINGWDDDCKTSATLSSCSLEIKFTTKDAKGD